MTLLNATFGFLIAEPLGWLIMLSVTAIECLVMSKILDKSWNSFDIYFKTIFANFTSGIVGFILSIGISKGWWLVVWFPWVSSNEVDENLLHYFIIYYLAALLLTIIVETLVFLIAYRKRYSIISIIFASTVVNLFSYFTFSGIIYLYSFRNMY